MSPFSRLALVVLSLSCGACRDAAQPAAFASSETSAAAAPKAALAAAAAAPVRKGSSANVYGLTGAHTRLVWVQGDGTDPYAAGSNLV